MADERLGIALTVPNKAGSQYMGMDFNSMCKFGSDYLGANGDGIFTVFDGDDDNGTDIDAYFILPVTDLGIPVNKQILEAYVGGETGGGLQLSVRFEDGSWTAFTLVPTGSSSLQKGQQYYGRYDQHGRYFDIKISNTDGSDFSVDQIDLEIVRKQTKVSGA